MLNSVTIKCRPAEIPEFLEIDVTDMEMNTNLFVRDITLPTDVEMLTADDIAVVSVQEPKEEKEEVVVEAESEEADEASDAEEQPADGEAQEESSEEAKDDAGEEG
jgi:large subunit ribosomal protein L25